MKSYGVSVEFIILYFEASPGELKPLVIALRLNPQQKRNEHMDITKKLNLKNEATIITEYFSPRIISEVNDQFVKLAKIKGEDIPWHNHKDEDELFYIIEGSLLMEIENKPSFEMNKGDLFIVKKGINHRVSSVNECLIMLIESKSTQHTGDVISNVTKNIDQQKY